MLSIYAVLITILAVLATVEAHKRGKELKIYKRKWLTSRATFAIYSRLVEDFKINLKGEG